MKLIIEIPEEVYKWIRDNYENPNEEIAYDSIKKGKPYEEKNEGDLISREALLNAIEEERQFLLSGGQTGAEHILVHHCLRVIDNAPIVPLPDFKEGYKQAIIDGKTNFSRKQGEWARHDEWLDCEYIGGFYHVNCSCEDGYYSKWKTDFCPNCGLPMMEGGEE